PCPLNGESLLNESPHVDVRPAPLSDQEQRMSDGTEVALVIGAGPGLSTSIARSFSAAGLRIALASRNPENVEELAHEVGGRAYKCDVSRAEDMAKLFIDVERD